MKTVLLLIPVALLLGCASLTNEEPPAAPQVQMQQSERLSAPSTPEQQLRRPNRSDFTSVVGCVYPRVKLYDGSLAYVGQIVSVNPRPRGARTIILRYKNGDEELKSWEALLKWGWFVRRDDPALAALRSK